MFSTSRKKTATEETRQEINVDIYNQISALRRSSGLPLRMKKGVRNSEQSFSVWRHSLRRGVIIGDPPSYHSARDMDTDRERHTYQIRMEWRVDVMK